MDTSPEAEHSFSNNFSQVCRLCLSEEFLEDIFIQGELYTWILELLSIKITQNDTISQSVCAECKIRLNEFREYRLQCWDVQNVLLNERAVINDEQNSPEERALESPRKDDPIPVPTLQPVEVIKNARVEEPDQEVILLEDLSNSSESSSECHDEDTREPNISVDEYYPEDCQATYPPTTLSSIEILESSDDGGLKPKKLRSQYSQRYKTTRRMCEMCGQTVQRSRIEGHMNRHLGLKPYKCERGCTNLTFTDKYNRLCHYRHQHDAPKYSCLICNRSFASRQGLFGHKQNHHATKSFKCGICLKKFVSEYLYKKHMLGHGAKEKKFSCSKCDASFPTEYALQRHIPQKHVGNEGDDFGRHWLQAQQKQNEVKCEGEVMLTDARQDECAAEEIATHSDLDDWVVINGDVGKIN